MYPFLTCDSETEMCLSSECYLEIPMANHFSLLILLLIVIKNFIFETILTITYELIFVNVKTCGG